MNMHRIIRLCFVLTFVAASTLSAQNDLVDEHILLTFIPNVQFAPFYVGMEDGYFAEAGLNLSVEHLQEPEVVDLVAVGQANFGIVSGEQVILARAQGRDIVYVYEWFQHYPVGVVVASAAGMDSAAGLRGLKVGIPGRFGASYSGLTTLLQSAGLSESDIELDEIGFNAPEVFCFGAVDAAVVYVNNEPLQIRNRALAGECGAVADVDVISVASQVDLVSNGMIVSRKLLENNPALIQMMVDSFAAALRATIHNPAHAYLVSLDFVDNLPDDADFLAELRRISEQQDRFLESNPTPQQIADSRQAMYAALAEMFDPDALTQFEVLLTTVDLWDAARLGYSDLASWEAMRDTLVLMNILDDAEADLEAAFTNRFVEGQGE